MFSLYNDLKSLLQQGGILLWLFYIIMFTIFYGFNVYLVTLFSCLVLLLTKNIRWDGVSIALMAFSSFYCMLEYFNGVMPSGSDFINHLLAPVAFYLFGKNIVERLRMQKMIVVFLIFMIILFSINLYYATLIDVVKYGFGNVLRIMSVGNAGELAATLYGVVASLGLAGVIVFVKPKESKNYTWWLLAALMSFSLFTVMHFINRTGLVVVIVTFLCVLVLNSKGNPFKLLIPVSLIILTLYLLIDNNIISSTIFDAYEARGESVADAGGRSWRWLDALEKLFTHPFGWINDITTFRNYVHNGWLDIARLTGVIPFAIYTVTNIYVICRLFSLVKGLTDNFLILLLVALNVCFAATYFVEPIMEGMPLYVYMYAMMWGIELQLLKNKKEIFGVSLR